MAWNKAISSHSWNFANFTQKFEQKPHLGIYTGNYANLVKLAVHQTWEIGQIYKCSPCIQFSLFKICNLTAAISQPISIMWKGPGFQSKITYKQHFSTTFSQQLPNNISQQHFSIHFIYIQKAKQKSSKLKTEWKAKAE